MEDCFGDNGVVAAVIVDVMKIPVIEEFVMSCRVMGKNIEHGIVRHVEQCLQKEGFEQLRGIYIPTAKNKPVADLYLQLGYERLQDAEGESGKRVYERKCPEVFASAFVGEIKEEV